MMMVVHVAFEGGVVMDPTADDGSVLGPGGRARSFAIEQYSNGLIPRSNIDSIPRPNNDPIPLPYSSPLSSAIEQ